MGATKNAMIDDLNAELDRHENCDVQLYEHQDWDDGIVWSFARCEDHKEDLSDEATAWYVNERREA